MSGLPIATDLSGHSGRSVMSGPDPVVAGARGVWTFRVEAGERAFPPGSAIAFVRRWPSDWDTPDEANTRVEFEPACRYRRRTYRSIPWHPFDHVFELECLDPVSALRVAFDIRAQTFIEEASPLSVRVRPGADGEWVEIAVHAVRVMGGAPARLDLVAPSDVVAGEAFELVLRVEDEWGNPASLDGAVSIEGMACVALPDLPGVRRWRAKLDRPGPARLVARAGALTATSNPIRVHAVAPARRLRWGDIHAQCVVGCGARTLDAFFAHARDFARLDFASHQANCFLVSTPEWRDTEEVTARYDEEGRFAALLGLEWSADTDKGGDRNLYFPSDAAPITRCSHEYVADMSDAGSDLPRAEDLHAHYRGTKTLIGLHVGGRTTDLSRHEPSLERLIEVHSTHATSEWFLFEALARGYRMGVTAGSDGVDGRPGASHPGHQSVRNVRGGLVAAPLTSLTREGVWEALSARRCYATNGPRIRLDFEAEGHPMGAEFRARRVPELSISVEGTGPLEAIDIFRGTTIVHSPVLRDAAAPLSDRVRIAWRGATAPGNFMKARMLWDGEATLDSGAFLDWDGYAFDTPDEGILRGEARRIGWKSATGGDWDGIVARIDAPAHAILAVATPQISVRVPLAALANGPARFADAKPARELEVRRLPLDPGPSVWSGAWRDPAPVPGWNAYWVRVRQWDGGFAWSSPIFVEMEGA